MTFRIAILGIGGVGGYLGGKLAARNAGSGDTEIVFAARGENAKAIEANGLTISTADGESNSRPSLVTDDPQKIGEVDLLVIATKAFDLEESVTRYSKLIGPRTSILPLLNGVDHADRIGAIYPDADVWNGCVFIVARLQRPGVVRVDSEIRLYQFGGVGSDREKLKRFESILRSAGVDSQLSVDIEKTVWEKFIFISPVATLTSAFDSNIGGLLETDEKRSVLESMIAEVAAVARAKRINVGPDIETATLEKIKKAPPGSTSSMHSDFKKGGRTELETLTGYVVTEAAKLGVAVPMYEKFYGELRGGGKR